MSATSEAERQELVELTESAANTALVINVDKIKVAYNGERQHSV